MDDLRAHLNPAQAARLEDHGSIWLADPITLGGLEYRLIVANTEADSAFLAATAQRTQQQLLNGSSIPDDLREPHIRLVTQIWNSAGVWIDGLGNQRHNLLSGLSDLHYQKLVKKIVRTHSLDSDTVFSLLGQKGKSCEWVRELLKHEEASWDLEPGCWAILANCGDEQSRSRLAAEATPGSLLSTALSAKEAITWPMIEDILDRRMALRGGPQTLDRLAA